MPGRDSDTARRQQLSSHPRLGGLLLNFLAAAVGLGVALGVVAYAVSVPDSDAAHSDGSAWQTLIPAPSGPVRVGAQAPTITSHPAAVETSTSAAFDFTGPLGTGPFSCRLDQGAWRVCGSPFPVDGLDRGSHEFRVRAARPAGAAGVEPALTYMRWSVVAPAPFSISQNVKDLGDLYPGAAPVALPLKVTNPNRVPIAVTSLRVAIARSPRGCPGAKNLTLTPSSVSTLRPLRIRAGASVWVPGRGITAPAIGMVNRPVNQDACRRAKFPLRFSGSAHG